ncbi:MAG: indole-3-glycerol phosphate synthase TrpC [Anaerolineales bacterium]|nr:indole-3-glycerol phosphate synthase TrpC [Anaerolineales bacterium]
MSILDEIFAHKRLEVAANKQVKSASDLEAEIEDLPASLDFAVAIKKGGSGSVPRLIAEVKYRSPSKGILCPHLDPQDLAGIYAGNGAAAISVLTDQKYFGGSLEILRNLAALDLGIPLLRKDFIFDDYQLLEARAAGASAALLIVAMLEPEQLCELLAGAHELGLEALVETHTPTEVKQALNVGARVIGVNNRDLHTFEVSLETSLQLRTLIPADRIMVAESGIHTREDVARLAASGIDAMLIGEGLVTAPDVAAKMREIMG